MALKLMYITNKPEVAKIAEDAGVDRIFIDMEYIGKNKRQGGMDTVQSHHTFSDIRDIKKIVQTAEIMVRINPVHEATGEYGSTKEEIDAAICAGADILMLPYFKTVEEVKIFLECVDGRVKVLPLLETPEAVEIIDDILSLKGIDEIFIGLNDLSLGYGKKFMFEVLADGTVERLCKKFRAKMLPFGFGGIAALGKGDLPSEYIIREHYRLGSECVILSRSFCNTEKITELEEIERIFMKGVREIRLLEEECQQHLDYFSENTKELVRRVNMIKNKK